MKKLLVFTDLDGTLLDHHNYDYSAAKPALQRLADLQFPLIFNSSKTIAEMQPFAQQLTLHHPIIAENGSVVVCPQGYFLTLSSTTTYFGCDYQQITNTLQSLRTEFGFNFTGFNDMSVEEVMAHTGLEHKAAQRARTRLSSEPLLWQQDEGALAEFKDQLSHHGLTLTRGGRFFHVMRPINKSHAMAWLLKQYQLLQPQTHWITVALGDSHNDVQMLQAADISVLIHNPAGSAPDVSLITNIILPTSSGPTGWCEAINMIIDQNIEE